MLWAHQWGHKGGSLEEVMPRANTGGPARRKLKVAFPGEEGMDTRWHLCFARNWEELWMTGPWLQRCKKVKCSSSSAVSFHQKADGQCLCVYVHVCMRFSHAGLQTHDGRNLAKHPVYKIMEDFTPMKVCLHPCLLSKSRKSPVHVSLLLFRTDICLHNIIQISRN